MIDQSNPLHLRLRELLADGNFDELCRQFQVIGDEELTIELRLLKSRALRLAEECEIPLEAVEDVLLGILKDDPNNIDAMIELGHYYVIQCREDEAREVYLKAVHAHHDLERDLRRLKDFIED